jgi:hypothetical protein
MPRLLSSFTLSIEADPAVFEDMLLRFAWPGSVFV